MLSTIKFRILLISLLTILILSGCNNGSSVESSVSLIESSSLESSSVTSSSDGGAQIGETYNYLELKNDFISVKFDKENGSMLSFVNKNSGTDFINDTVGGNWAMMVDVNTNNAYLTNYKNGHIITSRNQIGYYNKVKTDDGVTLRYVFDLEFKINNITYSDVSVTQEIILNDNDEFITFNYKIDNYSDKELVIVNFTGAQLSGVKNPVDGEPWTLFYPYLEGKLLDNAIDRTLTNTLSGKRNKVSNQYPSPISMQLFQLYNEEESIYLMVEDSKREYKLFNFGTFIDTDDYDYNAVSKQDSVSMSSTQFPFVESGKSRSLFPIKIGTSNKGSWHAGADVYREFLIKSGMTREFSDYVSTWNGTSVLIGSQYGNDHFASYLPHTYITNYNKWFTDTQKRGLDSTIIIGWHEGGFDSKYPDYDFHSGPGFNEDGFNQMMNKALETNFGVIPYINGHIADENSNWAKEIISSSGMTNLLQGASKSVGFNTSLPLNNYYSYMWRQYYGTPTTYYAMCPKSQNFIDALNDAIHKLAKKGAKGIWFDQIMEMPSTLCFDPTHGHKTPATAYGEGYKEMFAAFEKTFSDLGITDYIFLSEGVNDAWVEYIDVNGYMWARKLGGSKDSNGILYTPEITRYTIPAKFLGLESFGTVSGSLEEYWYAFLQADPFLGDPSKNSTKTLIEIYKKAPDVFYYGRYMDKLGFSVNQNIKASMLMNNDVNQLVIQVYNPNSTLTNVRISLNLNELGINGQVVKVEDLFLDEELSHTNGVFTISTLDTKAIRSYKITYVD